MVRVKFLRIRGFDNLSIYVNLIHMDIDTTDVH